MLSTCRGAAIDNGILPLQAHLRGPVGGLCFPDRIPEGGYEIRGQDGDISFNVMVPLTGCERRGSNRVRCKRSRCASGANSQWRRRNRSVATRTRRGLVLLEGIASVEPTEVTAAAVVGIPVTVHAGIGPYRDDWVTGMPLAGFRLIVAKRRAKAHSRIAPLRTCVRVYAAPAALRRSARIDCRPAVEDRAMEAIMTSARTLPFSAVELRSSFWRQRQRDTAEAALMAQWRNLEAAGTIDNFRIAANRLEGFRRGLFFVDSDAYKWADAAARTLQLANLPAVADHLAEFVDLVAAAQQDDGYLFTFNQVHFPEQRWVNLQIGHELYCLGHLIEAGIAAAPLARHSVLFEVARKAADLLVRVFADAGPQQTPGHPEVELALLRLADVTGDGRYANLAEHFLEQRGRSRAFGVRFLREGFSQIRRTRLVSRRHDEPDVLRRDTMETLLPEEGIGLFLRSLPQFLSGRYQQQHAPVRQFREPAGHAVRWGYLVAAAVRRARAQGDRDGLANLDAAWRKLIIEHAYVTGGVGAVAIVEGFGRPYALGNASAYCETCAAIATILWSRELQLATGEARFADFIEWQLHNAVAPGVSLDGRRYLYRNPLASAPGEERHTWFLTACCPSNVSRTWASLGEHVVRGAEHDIWIDQLWGTDEMDLGSLGADLRIAIDSDLPWHGRVVVTVDARNRVDVSVHVRIPGWSGSPAIRRDGESMALELPRAAVAGTASGLFTFSSYYVTLPGPWEGRTRIEFELPMEVRAHRADERVWENRGKVALSRGPIVYCLEAIDHPEVDIPGATIDLAAPLSLGVADDLGSCVTIGSRTPDGRPLRFIPYFARANRARGGMQVWVDAA